MEQKKKMGRPSQGKGWKSFSLDQESIDFLNTLPPGDRSRFVNDAVVKEIKRVRELQEMIKLYPDE